MIKIGLTGGIGSGKTTVANYFLELGIPVYFADIEAKKLMTSSTIIQQKINAEFGEESYHNHILNRAYLASIVFQNPKKLEKLNAIVHPEVAKHFSTWVKKQSSEYIVQENAILFENNTASNFDFIVMVTAPIDIRIQRVIDRDRVTKEDVLLRIQNQWDDVAKIKLADFVIHNIDKRKTKTEVNKLHNKLLKINIKSNKK